MQTPSLKDIISEQIESALKAHGPLTSAELVAHCPATETSTDVGRIMAHLYKEKLVDCVGSVQSTTPRSGSRLVKQWAWVGPHNPASEPVYYPGHAISPQPATPAMAMPSAPDGTAVDIALSYLVDQAEEAAQAMADELLAGHDGYQKLRQLAADAFSALCDYRARA